MTHIDRAAVNEQRPLNNRDGPIDARAEPAGLGEIDFQRGSLGIRFGQAGLQAVSEKNGTVSNTDFRDLRIMHDCAKNFRLFGKHCKPSFSGEEREVFVIFSF